MKKLLTILMMVVFGTFVFAGEVVVMTSNNTFDAFNRMYSIGTTQEVVIVENKELFNQITAPTFASAKVDGNKMTFVRGNDKFSSYSVKFVKETRTTYVFVSSDESDSTENLVEFETTSKVINTKITDDIVVEETIDTEVPVKIEENPIKGLIHFGTLVSITLLLSFGRISLKTSLRKKVENNINVGYTISKDLVISDVSVKKHKATRYIPGTGYLPVITNTSNLKVETSTIPLVKLDLNNSLNLTTAKNLNTPIIGIFKVGNSVTYKGFNFVIVAEEINSYRCWNGTYGFFNICKSDMLEGHIINYTMHFEEVCELFMPKDNGPTDDQPDYDLHNLYEIFEDSEGNCFWVFGIKGNNWKIMDMTTGEVSLLDRNSKRHVYASILSNFKGWFKVGDSVRYEGINFLIIAENPESFECYAKGKFFKLSKHEDLPGSIVNYNIGIKEIAELFENK